MKINTEAPQGTVTTEEDRVAFWNNGHWQWLHPMDLLSGGYAKLATEAGSGIAGIAETYKAGISRSGPILYTSIIIDLTGLDSSAAGDIIGDSGAANCHIGQITADRSGTLFAGRVSCLETPAGGEPDIDLFSAVEATGAEDAAVTGLDETTLLAAAADWTGNLASKSLTALPADGDYLYLVASGGGDSGTYTAGKLLIELWGHS